MSSPSITRRSPRTAASRRSLALAPGTPLSRGENAPIAPSPLRNEISSVNKGRKRARSLGGGGDDPTAPSSAKQVNPRKKRMTIVALHSMLLT
jgi:hypothetical protein